MITIVRGPLIRQLAVSFLPQHYKIQLSLKTFKHFSYFFLYLPSPICVLSVYTNHEKESELSSSAPPLMHKTPPSPARRQQLEMSATAAGATCQMPGLTIISTAPRCQMLPLLAQQDHHHVASVETFIGPPPPTTSNTCSISGNSNGSGGTLERRAANKHIACLQQQHHQQANNLQSSASGVSTVTSITSPATRCCNILGVSGNGAAGMPTSLGGSGIMSSSGGNIVQQPQHHTAGMPQVVSGSSMGYYDAYGAAATMNMPPPPPSSTMNMTLTGSLSRRTHLSATHAQQQQQQHPPPSSEYIGVETLDILQGVAPGKYRII